MEAPDHGHETTSEAYSYYLWLEAINGYVTGDFSSFNTAFKNLETYIIPTFQPTLGGYNPGSPATYADEKDTPQEYPSPMESGVPVGQDPLYSELKSAYGQDFMYSMHWMLDVDNIYGFGTRFYLRPCGFHSKNLQETPKGNVKPAPRNLALP